MQVKIEGQDRAVPVMLAEYNAIRAEITTSLTCQVQVLSFGAATVGLLAAAAANLWDKAAGVSGLVMLFGIPLVCQLTLCVHAGEQIRLMRAGRFLKQLEDCLNTSFQDSPAFGGREGSVLTWERWDIRTGPRDIDLLNRLTISGVFVTLAVGSALTGYMRYQQYSSGMAKLLGLLSGALGVASIVWLVYLGRFAYAYRRKPSGADDCGTPAHDGVGQQAAGPTVESGADPGEPDAVPPVRESV